MTFVTDLIVRPIFLLMNSFVIYVKTIIKKKEMGNVLMQQMKASKIA